MTKALENMSYEQLLEAGKKLESDNSKLEFVYSKLEVKKRCLEYRIKAAQKNQFGFLSKKITKSVSVDGW